MRQPRLRARLPRPLLSSLLSSLPLRLLSCSMTLLLVCSARSGAQCPTGTSLDTTATLGPNAPAGPWTTMQSLARGDSVIGTVIFTTDGNTWRALTPRTPDGARLGSFSDVHGPQASKADAIHLVVADWSKAHPRCVAATPVTPPRYTTTRVTPTPAGAVTAYDVHAPSGALLGRVVQAPAGKWTAWRSGVALSPVYLSLASAATRLAAEPAPIPPPAQVETVTVTRHDTVTVTRIVTRVDTVTIRVPAPAGVPCADSLLGPFRRVDTPWSLTNYAVQTACGSYLGQVYRNIYATGDTAWVAVPWTPQPYPWRSYASERDAMLSLEGRTSAPALKLTPKPAPTKKAKR